MSNALLTGSNLRILFASWVYRTEQRTLASANSFKITMDGTSTIDTLRERHLELDDTIDAIEKIPSQISFFNVNYIELLRRIVKRNLSEGFSASFAYDLCANYYDAWKWQKRWGANETPLVKECIRRAPSRNSILEIGIGTGIHAQQTYSVEQLACLEAIDISKGMLRICRKRMGSSISLRKMDAQAISSLDKTFDLIICRRVMSHIQSLSQVLMEVEKVTKPGSAFIYTDIDCGHNYERTTIPFMSKRIPVRTFKREFKDVVKTFYRFGFVPKKTFAITREMLALDPPPKGQNPTDSNQRVLNVVLFVRLTKTKI